MTSLRYDEIPADRLPILDYTGRLGDDGHVGVLAVALAEWAARVDSTGRPARPAGREPRDGCARRGARRAVRAPVAADHRDPRIRRPDRRAGRRAARPVQGGTTMNDSPHDHDRPDGEPEPEDRARGRARPPQPRHRRAAGYPRRLPRRAGRARRRSPPGRRNGPLRCVHGDRCGLVRDHARRGARRELVRKLAPGAKFDARPIRAQLLVIIAETERELRAAGN